MRTTTTAPGSDDRRIAHDEWPTPPAPAAFSGLAGEFVSVVSPHSEADPTALLGQGLVAFGNVIGRRAHFGVEADKHYTNEYVILVGETAKARKGTSWGYVESTFQTVDPSWHEHCRKTGLSSGEGLIWAVRDADDEDEDLPQQRIDKRRLIYESEYAKPLRMLQRDGNILSGVIRDAWDKGEMESLTKNSPMRATGVHLSIIGHITRDEALRYLDRTEIANGFGNRHIWLCVRRSKVLPEGGRVPPGEIARLAELFGKAVEFARGVDEVPRDDAARELWASVYESLSEGRPGLFGSITARAEAHVGRLSVKYALLDSSRIVRVAHLQAALALWDYAARSAAYVFGMGLGDPIADEILRALQAAPSGLTRSEIHALFGNNRKAGQINRALAELRRWLLADYVVEPTKGRDAERWFALTKETKDTKEGPFADSPASSDSSPSCGELAEELDL